MLHRLGVARHHPTSFSAVEAALRHEAAMGTSQRVRLYAGPSRYAGSVVSETHHTSPHGRASRAALAVSATLALLLGLVLSVGAVRWVQLRTVGTEPGFVPAVPTTSPGASQVPPPTGECSDQPCNYLILGSDSRAGLTEEELKQFGTDEDIGGENRADTIMLVHSDPALQQATILSFPRDLWVEIPERGWGKISAAFEGGVSGGGPQLMARTVANLTGLRIDHFLYVDLAGFQKIVDTLGGVEMCPPQYLADPETGRITDPLTGLDVPPGCQRFDGRSALAFVRTRHLPCDTIPDFSRIGRQQQFLRAVINQMLRPEQLVRAPGLVEPIVANMRRNKGFLPGDLVYLVGQLRGITTGAAEFRAVPALPAWEGSLAVVRMDPSAQQIFSAIRQGRPINDVGTTLVNTPLSPANVRVAVIDRGSAGVADEVEAMLSGAGFDISPGIWDDARAPASVSGVAAIIYGPGHDAEAEALTKYLPAAKVVESPALTDVPVAVLVTANYEPAPATSNGAASECPDLNP